MVNSELPFKNRLSRGAEFLIHVLIDDHGDDEPPAHAYHWIIPMLKRRGGMAEDIRPGFKAEVTVNALSQKLVNGHAGPVLSLHALIEAACGIADDRQDETVQERDIVKAALSLLESSPAPDHAPPGMQDSRTWVPRTSEPTPTLEHFGKDLTQAAVQGKLPTIMGREQEIQQIVETLCRRTKRNPALIGPAGVGKTAVVEGLAARIVAGNVPASLHGCRLIELPPTALVAGASLVGELEKRVERVLAEAKQDGIILFIDEVHSIIGAGGAAGRTDVASQLKPALARGEIACIVATTDMEYSRDIKGDPALERRFNPVPIHELSSEATMEILRSLAERERSTRGITVGEDALKAFVTLSGRYMRHRHFPDKALDLFDQSVASAVAAGCTTVELDEVRNLVQRKVGMPTGMEDGVRRLRERLHGEGQMPAGDADALADWLETSLRRLDLAPERPDAVVLLAGRAAAHARNLATMIAEELYGAPSHVVAVDMSRFVHSADVTSITGASAGHIGHGDPLPHDALQHAPWHVVLWENVQACHPQVRGLLARIAETGELQDSRGQTTHFCDTVVLMTASDLATGSTHARPVGFTVGAETPTTTTTRPDRARLVSALGQPLSDQVDLIMPGVDHTNQFQFSRLQTRLLDIVAERYHERGLHISWDPTFIDWLGETVSDSQHVKDYESFLNRNLSPKLISFLPDSTQHTPRRVMVRAISGEIVIDTDDQ